MYRYKTFSL